MTNCDKEIIEIERLTMELEQAKSALVSKWQPIETAPKDGTKVLLYFKNIDNADRSDLEAPCPSVMDVFISGYYVPPKTWNTGYETEFTEEGGWIVLKLPVHGCGCCSEPNPKPSGWLPIPEVAL